jgi:hypothetical protein
MTALLYAARDVFIKYEYKSSQMYVLDTYKREKLDDLLPPCYVQSVDAEINQRPAKCLRKGDINPGLHIP